MLLTISRTNSTTSPRTCTMELPGEGGRKCTNFDPELMVSNGDRR